MTVARGLRAAAVVLALVLVVAACTSSDDGSEQAAADVDTSVEEEPNEPTPPVGLRVGVVLPDATGVDASVLAAMTADVRRLDAERGPEIAEVRPYRPEGPEFVGDLAWALAERRTDLICVVGRGSRSLVTELAELHPNLAFCATPMATNVEVPNSVHVLEIRIEELGHLVGLAASEAADGGTVGIVLGTEALPRGAFRDGVVAGLGATESVQVTVDEELDVVAAVEQVLAEGVDVVVMDSVAGASEALDLAAEHALILSPDVGLRGSTADRSVLTWRIRWDLVLRQAIERRLEEGPVGPTSFGFREEVFTISIGDASTASVRSLVEGAVEGLTMRRLDPLEPAPPRLSEDGGGLPIPSDRDNGAIGGEADRGEDADADDRGEDADADDDDGDDDET